jgi:putative phage-type endonuclease
MSVSAKTKNGNMPKARSQRLGSADIAALLGLEDAFESPYSLWYRKVHGHEETEETPAMRFGKFAEPFILNEYQLREGAGQLVKLQAHHEYKPWPIASATLDAIEIDAGDSEPVDLEAKTTREYRWTELPVPYQAQMQWQMGVSGLKRGKAVVFYKPRTDIDVFVVDFDEAIFNRMLEVAREFWEKHVLGNVPPNVDGHEATTRTLKRFEATEGVIDMDQLAPIVQELGGIKAAIKDLEGSKDALENRIKAYLGNYTVGTIDGKPAATWKSSTSSRIDTKALEAEHPEIAAKFRVESETRRFLITKAFSAKKESE